MAVSKKRIFSTYLLGLRVCHWIIALIISDNYDHPWNVGRHSNYSTLNGAFSEGMSSLLIFLGARQARVTIWDTASPSTVDVSTSLGPVLDSCFIRAHARPRKDSAKIIMTDQTNSSPARKEVMSAISPQGTVLISPNGQIAIISLVMRVIHPNGGQVAAPSSGKRGCCLEKIILKIK